MQVEVHQSSFVIGQPITPVSWPRKLPKPTHINVNTLALRPNSADSSSTPSSSPTTPSSSSLSSSAARTESEVQRAVSRLLSLIKQLQDVLDLWARRHAFEKDVSDAFVLIGGQFDSTVHAFWRVGVDMSDLFHEPTNLRTALEDLLAETPSPQVLARYMPRIRSSLFNLLRGLQAKQAPYWAAVARARETGRLSMISSINLRDG